MSDIKYALYTSSKGFKVVGGTAAQFLKADGTLDSVQYIPLSQKNASNGVPSLDSTGKISNGQIPDRLVNKIIAIGGEAADKGFTGLYDRNQLALADKEHDVSVVINGSGSFSGTEESFKSGIFNQKPGFVSLINCDATTELIITINFSSVLSNYSRALWQPFVHTRFNTERYFRDITVEVMDNNNVWYSPANFSATNITNILNSGLYLFAESIVGTISVRGVRFKLSNPTTTDGLVYLSQIGFRHLSHTFAPQFPHRGDDNIFFGINNFTKSPTVPVATQSNQAVNFGQLSNYFTKSESLSQFVGKSGNETISGTKTFTNSPVVPNASSNGHAVNYGQMDSLLNATLSGFVPLGLLGVFNGVATLDSGGKVPASQLPLASDSTFGAVKLGSNVFVSGASSPSPEVAGRIYPVMQNSQNQLVVVVPWTSSTYTHPNSGVTAGTYRSVTVNAQGHVTGGTNPTTLAGYGITDAMSTSHPASNINQIWINTWNDIANYGIRVNQEFTYNLGTGLVIADDYFGGDSGIVDRNQERFLAVKRSEYYIYGSRHDEFDGLNYHTEQRAFGMGREANGKDKLTVEGSVKASKNFKSEDEEPDTIFIPDGNIASLTDEIINDQSGYAVRLDPHEYYVPGGSVLKVDDRNRLIHIIGQEIKMAVDFMKIHPKQQIVIYNFDQSGTNMPVMLMGKQIANIPASCFIRLYVTKSLRVIIEKEQSCKYL